MSTSPSTTPGRWPGPFIVAGGVIMASLFPVFSVLHGPTSSYEGGEWLGLSGLVWGALMNGVPSLMIASGLIGARAVVTAHGRRAVHLGYLLVLAGLLIPGVLDLATRAIGAPLLMPMQAVGLLLLGLGGRTSPALSRVSRAALVGMGTLLLLAFLTVLIPMDLSDRLNGYRVFGVVAYELVGIGWIIFGTSLARGVSETPRPRV